jgi:hypothetical protein
MTRKFKIDVKKFRLPAKKQTRVEKAIEPEEAETSLNFSGC